MEKMKDLRDLLHHEVLDLTSAEDQIIAALPKMIEKAGDPALKKALNEHLKVTEQQRKRLDQVHSLLHGGKTPEGEGKGFLGGLFGGGHKCKGTQGLIEEGEKVMGEDMNPEVMDAAIIACSQKIEHYEICGYGTAKAFALELGLNDVARLLDQTLQEEYEADDRLTAMAVGRLNKEAEEAEGGNRSGRGKQSGGGRSSGNTKGASKAGSAAAKGGTKTAAKKGSSKSAGTKTASKSGNTKTASKSSKSSAGSTKTAGRSTKGSGSSKGGSKSGRKR